MEDRGISGFIFREFSACSIYDLNNKLIIIGVSVTILRAKLLQRQMVDSTL